MSGHVAVARVDEAVEPVTDESCGRDAEQVGAVACVRELLQGAVEPISVAQFTDVTDWYLIADPALIEGLEIGFVGGREAPDLLLQDAPGVGAV